MHEVVVNRHRSSAIDAAWLDDDRWPVLDPIDETHTNQSMYVTGIIHVINLHNNKQNYNHPVWLQINELNNGLRYACSIGY
jgi:hypothetical protein